MFKDLKHIYKLYSQLGKIKAIWIVIRLLILPFRQLDRILPKKGLIIDIGGGQGGFAHYLSIMSKDREMIGIDLSSDRVKDAKKTETKNVKFIFGDINSVKFPKANAYLLADVLHHISYKNQEKLLRYMSTIIKNDIILVIKDVDKSNLIPYYFGHTIEKILYPTEEIFTRAKSEWIKLFDLLGWDYQIEKGNIYFPDSTLIFICKKRQ